MGWSTIFKELMLQDGEAERALPTTRCPATLKKEMEKSVSVISHVGRI
jgi:hypothetical protein